MQSFMNDKTIMSFRPQITFPRNAITLIQPVTDAELQSVS